jgi:hypothetical protein
MSDLLNKYHFLIPGNAYREDQSYTFDEANTDQNDVNLGISGLVDLLNKGMSQVKSGLIPYIPGGETKVVGISYGEAYFAAEGDSSLYPFSTGSDHTSSYLKNISQLGSLIRVGRYYDIPAQSVSATPTDALIMPHRVSTGVTIYDPVYGNIAVSNPVAILADASMDTSPQDYYSSATGPRVYLSGSFSVPVGSNFLVSYDPSTLVTWIDYADRGSENEIDMDSTGVTLIAVNGIFTLEKVGYTVQRGTGIGTENRKIVRFIDSHTVEIDFPFTDIYESGDKMFCFNGDALLPSSSTRKDLICIKKWNYISKTNISTVGINGITIEEDVVSRFTPTFQLEVMQGVSIEGVAGEGLSDTDIQRLGEAIPLALVTVSSTGVTSVTHNTYWLNALRDKHLFSNNLISNGTFKTPTQVGGAGANTELFCGYTNNWVTANNPTLSMQYGVDTQELKVCATTSGNQVAYVASLEKLGASPGDILIFTARVKGEDVQSKITIFNSDHPSNILAQSISSEQAIDPSIYKNLVSIVQVPYYDTLYGGILPTTKVYFWINTTATTDVYVSHYSVIRYGSKDNYILKPLTEFGNQQVLGDLTIQGNLNVFGTRTYLESTILQVEDPNIDLNKGGNSTTVNGSGINILSISSPDNLVASITYTNAAGANTWSTITTGNIRSGLLTGAITADSVNTPNMSTNSLLPSGSTTTLGGSSTYWDSAYVSTANLTTANITTANIVNVLPSGSSTTLGGSSTRWSTAYVSTADVTTANITTANANSMQPSGTSTAIGGSSTRWNSIYGSTADLTTANITTVNANSMQPSGSTTKIGGTSTYWDDIYVSTAHLTTGNITTVNSDNILASGSTKTIGTSGNPWTTAYLTTANITTITADNILASGSTKTIGTSGNPWTMANITTINAAEINATIVNVNNLLPDTDNSNDIGSSSTKWRNAYVSTIYTNSILASGSTKTIGTSGNPWTTAYLTTANITTITADNILASGSTKTIGTSGTPWTTAYISTATITTGNIATINTNSILASGTTPTIGSSSTPYSTIYADTICARVVQLKNAGNITATIESRDDNSVAIIVKKSGQNDIEVMQAYNFNGSLGVRMPLTGWKSAGEHNGVFLNTDNYLVLGVI